MNDKKPAFEYFLIELMKWNMEYKNLHEFDYQNDLSLLKSLKILFFAVALDSENNNSLLDTTFTNFYAMPLGPVELDIYNQVKKEKLNFFIVDRHKLTIKDNYSWKEVISAFTKGVILSTDIMDKISNAVTNLKLEKKSLIKYKAFELVELSHSYNSWITTYNSSYSNSTYINPLLIKKDFINLEASIY